jgi:hypothetical protein
MYAETGHDICNMCKAAYIYSIETLEEAATPVNRVFYYITSTPVAGIPIFLVGSYLPHLSQTLITYHSLIAVVYLAYIPIYVKNPVRYIWYYFKDWSIHILALIAVFTIIHRNDHYAVLQLYHLAASCIWYTTQKVDADIRKSINNRIYKGLLEP